jgi:hypothetical protein
MAPTVPLSSGIVDKQLKPFFGSIKLAAVRRKDVVGYIKSRMGEVGDRTIIKEVGVLKRLFNVAIEGEKIAINPAQRAPLPKAPEGRVRYLSTEESAVSLSRMTSTYCRSAGEYRDAAR